MARRLAAPLEKGLTAREKLLLEDLWRGWPASASMLEDYLFGLPGGAMAAYAVRVGARREMGMFIGGLLSKETCNGS